MTTEKDIQNMIMLKLSNNETKLFRNNVGLFITKDGRKVRTGLCVGSADIIGFTSVTVTKDMVGQKIGVFTAIEVKKDEKKKPSDKQKNFIDMVKSLGGYAGVAYNIDTARGIINEK